MEILMDSVDYVSSERKIVYRMIEVANLSAECSRYQIKYWQFNL